MAPSISRMAEAENASFMPPRRVRVGAMSQMDAPGSGNLTRQIPGLSEPAAIVRSSGGGVHNHFDQFAKNLLREALGRAAREVPETEVEVQPGAQTIDVYGVADPAREEERAELGLLGELAAGRTLFEPFHKTPSLREVRSCLRKQLNWHHELERRDKREVEFPALVIIGPGVPRTALRAFGCSEARTGVYDAVDSDCAS